MSQKREGFRYKKEAEATEETTKFLYRKENTPNSFLEEVELCEGTMVI